MHVQEACVSLVQTLVREHKADVHAHDDTNNAPLIVAAFCGKTEIALYLINEFALFWSLSYIMHVKEVVLA